MTSKVIFGLRFTIYSSELSKKDLLEDVIQRTAKCLRDRFWLWQDIKQFNISPEEWDETCFEIMILFNNFYTEADLAYFVKECANFGNSEVYTMELT